MGLESIFEADPEAMRDLQEREQRSAQKTSRPDYAFQLRTGTRENGRAVSLSEFRFLAGTRETAERIGEMFGGTPDEYNPAAPLPYEVLSSTSELEIILDGPKSVYDRMIQWPVGGGGAGPIHECDGFKFLSPADMKGEPCGCPTTLAQRKKRAFAKAGPSPSVTVSFRLAQDPDLGMGKVDINGWTVLNYIHHVKNALVDIQGEALAKLKLERRDGKNDAGETFRYTVVLLDVQGSYQDAIAEER